MNQDQVSCSLFSFQPFNTFLAFSGKTVFVEKLLRNMSTMFTPEPTGIIVSYKEFQQRYTDWEVEFPNVKLFKGLDDELFKLAPDGTRNLLVK